MSIFITFFALLVLGVIGVYLLNVAKGIAYFVFLLALGFGIYRFTEVYIAERPIDLQQEAMNFKGTWTQKSKEELNAAANESEGSSLSRKVGNDLQDMAGKSFDELMHAAAPDPDAIARAAMAGAGTELSKHTGFFQSVKNVAVKSLEGVISLLNKF